MPGTEPVVLKFDLPFCIHLQNRIYEVGIGSRVVRVETKKLWRNSKDCSEDDSIGEEKQLFPEGSYETGPMGEDFDQAKTVVGTNMEMIDDPHGRFRFTRVAVLLHHPDPDNVQAPDLLREALAAANRLVDVYRYVTDQAYLPPVRVEDVEYAEVFVPSSRSIRYSSLFGKGMTNAVINESREVHERVLGMLKSKEEVPLHAELRLAARRLLGEGLARQAIVEAVSGLEAFLGEVIRRGLVNPGKMTEAEFDEVTNQPPTDRLKAPLRDAVGCSPVDRHSLWLDWIQCNRTRRKVVHRGAGATEGEATMVVETIERLITYVNENRTK